jgi:hypothetical protein
MKTNLYFDLSNEFYYNDGGKIDSSVFKLRLVTEAHERGGHDHRHAAIDPNTNTTGQATGLNLNSGFGTADCTDFADS